MSRRFLLSFFIAAFFSTFLFSCSLFRVCSTPILVSNLKLPYIHSMAVAGNFIYTISHEKKNNTLLSVVNISNPTKPILVGSLQIHGNACDLTVVEKFAYVACRGNGLMIVNISNPTKPVLIGALKTQYALRVTVVGSFAYVGDGEEMIGKKIDGGLKIINISNPAKPVLVGSLTAPFSCAGKVKVVGKFAYVTDGDGGKSGGLKIIDISNQTKPVLVGDLQTHSSYCFDMDIVDNFAYVVDTDGNKGKLKIVDISNPAKPVLIGGIQMCDPLRVTVVKNLSYIIDNLR